MEERDEKSIDAVSQAMNPSQWYYRPFFQYACGALLVLLIILVFYHVAIFLHPFFDFISIVFAPIVISLLFYYLLRPIVYFFES